MCRHLGGKKCDVAKFAKSCLVAENILKTFVSLPNNLDFFPLIRHLWEQRKELIEREGLTY